MWGLSSYIERMNECDKSSILLGRFEVSNKVSASHKMSQDELRLLCGGTQKSDGGELKGNRSLEWEVSDVLWNTEQTPPALVRRVQANERNLAANNRLKGHPPLQYKESSIEPKDENWFLRMCHYFVNSFVLTIHTRACFVFLFYYETFKTILTFSVLRISRFVLECAAV